MYAAGRSVRTETCGPAAVRRAASAKAVARVQNRLLSRQAAVQSRLTRALRQEQVEYGYSYTALFNGFSVRTARKNLEAIRNTKGVTCAFVAGSYALPTTQQADTQALQVALASSRFTGKGMTIAVLDTGLDTAHPAFANAPADAKFTKDYISGVLQAADLNAEVLMPGVTADDVYLSAKIPFAFDYAGKDAQVAPGSKWDAENLEHGTHVAGIAAGYAVDGEGAVTFSGVAPDAQVIPMKVFDDSGTGAATTTILAALEDAYRLGVDAVNLSLGSYCGFTVDEDALINDVYNKLDDAGIMVITAAGNETSSSYMNSYGTDAPLTGDPDNSVVAAPSVYPANLSVTNADGQEVWSDAVTNVPKTIYVSSQGGPIPATMYQDMAPDAWYGTDNQGSALPDGQYYYTITADPVTDHESRNVRDTLTFPVYIDTQAPQLDQGCVALSTGADGRTTLGMQVSDEHLYLDTEIFVANDDGTISTNSEKLLHKNVGLADMPDVTSDAVSVDVTDYAGKLLYVQLTDWGYNYAAYLVQLPDTFEGTTLSLSDTTAFLFTGEQQQLVAFDTDTDTALTWTSSNADVASVDENGLVTAKAPGVTTVTATTANGASVSCVVGVSDQLTYTGLRLDFDEMTTTMYFDSTIDLPGVYLEPYGFALSGKHNTYGADGLTWSVSDPTIAGLDEYSKTTLVANKDGKSGDVTVTAEYQGMTASFTVHVGPYPGSVELYHGWIQARSNRIFLQGKQGIVGAGRDGIHATDTAATSDDQIITFTNSDPNVVDLTNPVIRATSNRDLPDECAYVDARNPGNAVITATATSTTQDTVQCFVTVVPKWYDGIQATQDTIQLKLGQGADLTQYLTLLDESGVVIPELNPVNYASLDESILSVDASGHVTALHTGTGMVRALLNTGDYALIAVEVTCDHDHTTRTETPATCTQDGSVTVTCDDCGAVLSTEAIPATGHDYKDGKCTVCGAADPDYRPEQPEDPGQPEKPEQPANPGVRTGDSGVLLYMGLMLLALTGSAWVLRKKRAR